MQGKLYESNKVYKQETGIIQRTKYNQVKNKISQVY